MSESTEPVRLITPGIIAAALGVPIHRVNHILRTRAHLRPVARAGVLRCYEPAAVAMVRHELSAIDARRMERKPIKIAG